MEQHEHDRTKKARSMSRALRDLLLEASEDELREALVDAGEDFDTLAEEGRADVERALANAADRESQVHELHQGLATLVHMLRRRERLTREEANSTSQTT